MAIENIPMFSAMNKEEVKPPFPRPNRPLTSQEAHFAIMEKVNACINEVNLFEQRVRAEMDRYFNSTTTENTAFKEAIQASYNAFLETVQREVNNFETNVTNNYDLFRADIDNRIANFETAINNEFEALENNINNAFDVLVKEANDKIAEMNTWLTETSEQLDNFQTTINNDFAIYRQEMNTAFTTHKNECNALFESFKSVVNTRLTEQDNKIDTAKAYMVTNLQSNVRTIFDEKARDGTIVEIMKDTYGQERIFKGADTTANILMKTDNTVGEYWYSTDEDTYYQYCESGFVNIGKNDNIANEVIEARTNSHGETFGSLREAVRNSVHRFENVVNEVEVLRTNADVLPWSVLTNYGDVTITPESANFTRELTTGNGGFCFVLPFDELKYDKVHFECDFVNDSDGIAQVAYYYYKNGVMVTGNSEVIVKLGSGGSHNIVSSFTVDKTVDADSIYIIAHSVSTGSFNFTMSNAKVYLEALKDSKIAGNDLNETVKNIETEFNNLNVNGAFYSAVVEDVNPLTSDDLEPWNETNGTIERLDNGVRLTVTGTNVGVAFYNIENKYEPSKPIYVDVKITENTGQANVIAWGKKADGSNTSMIRLPDVQLIYGEYNETLIVDLQYLTAHKEFDHDIMVLIYTNGPDTSFIVDAKMYQHNISNRNYVGETLSDFMENVSNKLDEIGSSDTTVANYLVAPNGKKFVTQIASDGSSSSVPVIPNNVLFVGNSLLAGHGTFGMCAKDSTSDYYYYVCSQIEKTNPDLVKNKIQGSPWEGKTTIADQTEWLESNLKPLLNNEIQLVVIQLSDNVNTTEGQAIFAEGSKNLLAFVRDNAPNARVCWVAAWYPKTNTQTEIANACTETGSIFINIRDLANVDGNRSFIGEVITDDSEKTTTYTVTSFTDNGDGTITVNFDVSGVSYSATINYTTFTDNGDSTISVTGNQHIVTNAGVASHPSSAGMLAIANRICYKLGITNTEMEITA